MFPGCAGSPTTPERVAAYRNCEIVEYANQVFAGFLDPSNIPLSDAQLTLAFVASSPIGSTSTALELLLQGNPG
jgi:hypothetical protein